MRETKSTGTYQDLEEYVRHVRDIMEPILSKLDEINCTRNIFEETEVKAIKLDM